MKDFETWWEGKFPNKDVKGEDGYFTEEYEISYEVAEHVEDKIKEVLERLENYRCYTGCHLTAEELFAARNVKESFIEILKEELL
jgi:hypothetical protein